MSLMQDPDHPILERSWEYQIFRLNFWQSEHGESESFIDLTLKKGNTLRHFRFFGPQELEIENGFPANTGGFCILDVSQRGLEGLRVRVDDFEADWGVVRFWARSVVEIGEPTSATEA